MRSVIWPRADYFPGSAGYYALTDQPLQASRQGGDHHRFVTLEFSREHLQKQLADCEAELDPELRAAVFPRNEHSIVSAARPMSTEQHNVVGTLLQPPVAKSAQSLWYQSKALELMAHFLFTPKDPELFCMRQKRVARDRVERTKELLARNLAEPPTLEMLGSRGWLQSILFEPDFFARSRPHHSAIPAQTSDGTCR